VEEQTPSEKAVFHAALELTDAGQRRELLDSACKGAPTLRRQVEELLAAHDENMLQVPAGAAAEFGVEGKADMCMRKTIGHYKLLEKIGEGGFGVVYMADQLEPIQRRVALKIIKEGMDTREVIARFEAERQALSVMNHPHIAMVLDAGTTDAGRPYFVMELVRGVPVTEYCDQEQLSTGQRLKVFADVCSAIQHAHQKGIIHRDIKPSNVLVTTDGDRPVPKVIDFGIAKAIQGRLTDKTLFTHFRQFIGTPVYMSPEQSRMSARDVDTRTDIYSLGVLLYELLTGNPPLDARKLESEPLDEICRQIRESEASKPSTRLSTMTQFERRSIASKRKTEPERLCRIVRGELDWIVMKAIEKDRARRYETAAALAADIQRYLTNEPIEAGPPSFLYRAQKFASRNRMAASMVATIACALVVGTAFSTVGLVQARRAQRGLEVTQEKLTDQLAKTESARQQAEINLYVSDMNRAATAYDESNIGLASSLLATHEASYGERFEWRCLQQLCQGDALHTFRQHTGPVNSVAVSQHGLIASGSSDRTFRLFDIKTKREIVSREVSTGVKRVAFTPDGRLLAVAEDNSQVTLWSVESLKLVAELPQHQAQIADIEFSPDGAMLALAPNSMGNPLRLWNWRSQELFAVPREEVKGRFVSFSSTGRFVALFGPTPQVSLAEAVASGTYTRYAEMPLAHDWDVKDVAFSRPDERYLATADGTQIRMWDLAEVRQAELAGKSAQPVSVLRARRSAHGTRTLSFSPDGRYLASGGRKGNVNLWRGRPPWRREDYELVTWRGHSAGVTSIAYSHDGAFVVSGSEDHSVRLWPGDASQIPVASAVADDWIFAVAFSPDDGMLAAGGFDGRVSLFDTRTMEKRFDERLHDNQVMGVAISPNGRWLASCEGGWRWAHGASYYSPGRGVSLVNLEDRERDYYFDDIPVSVRGAIDFSPDSRSLVMGDFNGCLWVWDVQQRRLLKRTQADEQSRNRFWHAQYSPDGKTIATVGSRGVELRNAHSLEITTALVDAGGLGGADFSADGQLLACTSGQQILLLNASNLDEVKMLQGHSFGVQGLAFLRNGKTLASSSGDGTVKLWSLEAGQEVVTLYGHRGSVTGLAASHDGNMLASSGDDRSIRLWRAAPLDKPSQRTGDTSLGDSQ
jgi:WD40 repeat protein/serine/threonine protein kinase